MVEGERERERQNGSCPVKRAISVEAKAVRSGLIWVACLLPGAMVKVQPGLLPRIMSGSTALMQPWSVLMSMATVTTEGKTLRMPEKLVATCSHIGAQESCYCRGHWSECPVLPPRAMETSGPELQLRISHGSGALPQPGLH